MKQAMSNTAESFFTLLFFQQLVLALSIYSIGLVNYIFALRFIKLSIAYPLNSLTYVGILWGSYYFFDEKITLIRITGVFLIFLGVLFVVMPIKNNSIIKRESN